MKKLFLDTANFEQIDQLIDSSAFGGVTTNPSLISKEEKGDYLDKVEKIARRVAAAPSKHKHLSIEVLSLHPKNIVEEALEIRRRLTHVDVILFVKVPVLLGTMGVITELGYRGVKVNATACMNRMQARLAQDAGADVISFFYNRIRDGGGDPDLELSSFRTLKYEHVQVIAGSIRTPDDVAWAWDHGADIVTASVPVIQQMLYHPQTEKAVKQFHEDIDRWRS